MLELLLKYGVAEIVPMQKSYFHVAILPKKIKFSKELIRLNYEKLSPFDNAYILTYLEDKRLYLWFTQLKNLKKIVIPEAFLIYQQLKMKNDGIYIFDTEPKKVFIIKNNLLENTFVSTETDDTILNILKVEYLFEKYFLLSSNDFNCLYKKALKKITILELYNFSQISLTKESIQRFFIQKLTYPFIFFMLFYIGITYTQAFFMQQKIDKLTEAYNVLKNKNHLIKDAIKKHNIEVDNYKKFINTELYSYDPYSVLYDMYSIINKGENTFIKSMEIANNHVKLMIQTNENAIKYLNRLNEIPYFKRVVIENNFHKKGTKEKIITYSIDMKVFK